MPQRRGGWRGAAHGAFGALGNMGMSMFQNNLLKERQLETGQQYIDASTAAAEERTSQANIKANIDAGLPPDTTPEDRAQHQAYLNAISSSRDDAAFLAGIGGGGAAPPAGGTGGPGGGGAPSGGLGPAIALRDNLPLGHPMRGKLDTFFQNQGLSPITPETPLSGQTEARPVPQGTVGSLQTPREQFARDQAAQAATQERLAELSPEIVGPEAEREGALAEARQPSLERIEDEAEARAKGTATGTPADPETFSQAQVEAASFYGRGHTANQEIQALQGGMMVLGRYAPMAGEQTRAINLEADEFIRVQLRRESGAAITEEERAEYATILPEAFDTPADLARKDKIRDLMMSGLFLETGGAPLPEIGPRFPGPLEGTTSSGGRFRIIGGGEQ